jgi:hypothetical protein
MRLSDDLEIRAAIKQFIENERGFRRTETSPNAQFLDGKEGNNPSRGMSTIVKKPRRACKNQDVKLKLQGAFIVIKGNEPEKKRNAAVAISRYLTQKIMRSWKIDTLLRKEKYKAIFATLKHNLASNKMLSHEKIIKSDAFVRLTVAARADVLPRLANTQQWYHQFRTKCQKCNRDLQPRLAQIMNDCVRSMTQMTRHHNKVGGVIRRVIEEYMKGR